METLPGAPGDTGPDHSHYPGREALSGWLSFSHKPGRILGEEGRGQKGLLGTPPGSMLKAGGQGPRSPSWRDSAPGAEAAGAGLTDSRRDVPTGLLSDT